MLQMQILSTFCHSFLLNQLELSRERDKASFKNLDFPVKTIGNMGSIFWIFQSATGPQILLPWCIHNMSTFFCAGMA